MRMRLPVAFSDIQNCDLDCLQPDTFTFPGSADVQTVYIQNNNFAFLPEALLRNMASMLFFYARNLRELHTLPEQMFHGQGQLQLIYFTGSSKLGGSQERLPDGLFRGLTGLVKLSLQYTDFQNLPNTADLTVRARGSGYPCARLLWCVGPLLACVGMPRS